MYVIVIILVRKVMTIGLILFAKITQLVVFFYPDTQADMVALAK